MIENDCIDEISRAELIEFSCLCSKEEHKLIMDAIKSNNNISPQKLTEIGDCIVSSYRRFC